METVKGIEKDVLGRFKLGEKEINSVLDIIESQVEKSCKDGSVECKDGLVLGKNDLVIEKFLFLCMIERWGGIEAAKKNLGAERVEKDIDDSIKSHFEPFKVGNSIKSEIEQERNQQKYTAHLEAVKKGIMELFR